MCSWCIVTNLFLFQRLTHKKVYLTKTEHWPERQYFFHARVHSSVQNVVTCHLDWFGDIPVYSDRADISLYIKVLQTGAGGRSIVASFYGVLVFLAKAATLKHVVIRSCTPLIIMPCWWVHMVRRNLAGTRASTQRLELTIWWYSCHLDTSTSQQTHICWQHKKPFSWWETLQNPQISQSSVGFLVICLNFNEHQSVCLIGRITHSRLSLSPVVPF